MNQFDEFRMDKTQFSTVSLFDEADDKAYWLAQTPQARLEAAEHLRQVAYGYVPTTARLQRLFTTADREEC